MKEFARCRRHFNEYVQGLGFADETAARIRSGAGKFLEFMTGRGKTDVRDMNTRDIQEYRTHLSEKKTPKGKPYSTITIYGHLNSVDHFFTFLYLNERIIANPMEDFENVRKGIEARREIFSRAEINAFLDGIDAHTPEGARDRAIFELMYSSGLRRREIINLKLEDVDLPERVLVIRQGKGGKDRYVPFSETARVFLKRYIENGRKILTEKARPGDIEILFLLKKGRMTTVDLHYRFRERLQNSGIRRKGLVLHSIRHTTATHLLEAGADVRFVQELLGHEKIQTTVRYTHLLMEHLKRAYRRSHPRENDYYEEIDEKYTKDLDTLREELKHMQKKSSLIVPSDET